MFAERVLRQGSEVPRTREKGHNLLAFATHGRVTDTSGPHYLPRDMRKDVPMLRPGRDIRKTCPARTVVLPMQPTAGFDELS